MSDRRLELLVNAEAALNVDDIDVNGEATERPSGLQVERHRMRPRVKGQLPDMSVEYLGESVTDLLQGPTDVDERNVRIGVRIRAVAGTDEAVDEALFPLLGWAELALTGVDYTLEDVASFGFLERIEALRPEELADAFVGCRMIFAFTVPTKRADPRQAP